MSYGWAKDAETMTFHCEYCGIPTTQRYCDDECRQADKTGTGPKACAFIAGITGWCDWHKRPAEACEADEPQDAETRPDIPCPECGEPSTTNKWCFACVPTTPDEDPTGKWYAVVDAVYHRDRWDEIIVNVAPDVEALAQQIADLLNQADNKDAEAMVDMTDDATTLARARELARRIPKDLAVIEVITPDGRDLADDVIELLELLGT